MKTNLRSFIHTLTSIYTHRSTHIQSHRHTRTHTHKYIYVDIISIYIYIHSHAHAHVQGQLRGDPMLDDADGAPAADNDVTSLVAIIAILCAGMSPILKSSKGSVFVQQLATGMRSMVTAVVAAFPQDSQAVAGAMLVSGYLPTKELVRLSGAHLYKYIWICA